MSTRLLEPGDLVLDWSFARPSPAAAVKAGARGVHRYTAGAATDPHNPSHGANQGKIITPREFDGLLAAGLDVMANDEWYATRITEGPAAAEADAKAAAAHWKLCGLAEGAAIVVSYDTAPLPHVWPAVDAHLAAYAHVAREEAGYHVGVYAGDPYLRHAADLPQHPYLWRSNAPSWSERDLPWQPNTRTALRRRRLVKRALAKTPANLWQTGNTWFHGSADENLVLRVPLGSHLEALATITQPPPPPPPPPGPGPKPPAHGAHRLISPDGHYTLHLTDNGHLQLDLDGKPVLLP